MNFSPEPLEDINNYRLFINPNKENNIFKFYKEAQSTFWVEEEIESELNKDSLVWPLVDSKIQNLIKHQIAFFLIGDGKVNQTISDHIDSRITDREVLLWYNYQKMMEDIHNIVYVKLADTYITNSVEKKKIFDAVENYPIIKKKINWLAKWLEEGNDIRTSEENIKGIKQLAEQAVLYQNICSTVIKNYSDNKEMSNIVNIINKNTKEMQNVINKINKPKPLLARQILINIIMEGLFFQGSFCIIFWYGHYFGNLPGLTKANEFISRDEGLHTRFGIYLYKYKILNKLSQKLVWEIFDEAVNLEIEFMAEALPSDLLGMNLILISQYIKFVADRLLIELGYEKKYNVENPFGFMNKQSISVRVSDFFIDNNVSEYAHFISGSTASDQTLNFTEDF